MAVVLVLGAGREQIPLIRAIHGEGHKVAAVDIRDDAEGVPEVDIFEPISNRDAEAAIAFGWRVRIHAVMVAASEVADVGAKVAHALRLPGISIATALACKDKVQQKKVLHAAGVPCSEAHVVFDGAAKALFDLLGHRVVVKPRFGSGSRGVTYVENPMELLPAIQAADAIWPEALIERYEPGPQISVESLVWRGLTQTPCVVDRWYPPGRPVFREVGGSWPSIHDTPEVHETMAEAALALGIVNGTLKADIVVTPDGPKVIELTPRLSGGPLASFIRDGMEVDYLRAAVRIALGDMPRLPLNWSDKRRVARLMDGTDVPWETREKYLGGA
jgi:biotin carboxylase